MLGISTRAGLSAHLRADTKDGASILIQMYFCKGYDCGEKVDLSKGNVGIQKEKCW